MYNPLERLGLTVINRRLSPARVASYVEEMASGRWVFSPDPIVVSEDGYLVNGQHRLLAAGAIEWKEDAPQLLVVWGVDRKSALLMDEARRSANDCRHIAVSYAGVIEAAAAVGTANH